MLRVKLRCNWWVGWPSSFLVDFTDYKESLFLEFGYTCRSVRSTDTFAGTETHTLLSKTGRVRFGTVLVYVGQAIAMLNPSSSCEHATWLDADADNLQVSAEDQDVFEIPLAGYSRSKGTGAAEPLAGAVKRVRSSGGGVLALTSARVAGGPVVRSPVVRRKRR